MIADNSLGWLRVSGTPYEVGRALGQRGRDAVHAYLIPTADWRRITDPRYAAATERMSQRTKSAFPWIQAELEGLADGLELAFGDVFTWNCRGDLLAHAPDGCTTVQLPGASPVVAHNEDGLVAFDGQCFIAESASGAHGGFLAFCYPGSIRGHTFAVTGKGLVATINNLRLRNVEPEIPRMVLSRAVVDADSVDAALAILREAPASGGFHLTLAQAGDPRIVSVEYGGGQVVARTVMAPSVHANHALLIPQDGIDQTVTASSRDRQARGSKMLADGCRGPMTILRDTEGPGLPLWRRDADDPDEENTMASAVFHVHPDTVRWRFYHGASDTPVYASEES